MKQIIRLLNKNFDKDFDISNYKKVDLFSIKSPNGFQKFLIDSRIRVFQKLFVLDRLCRDEVFFIGCEKLFYSMTEYDFEDYIEVGECVIRREFSKEDIFNKFVSGLAIAQIDTPHFLDLFEDSLACAKDVDMPEGYHLGASEEVIVSENLIIADDVLWFTDADKAKEMLAEFDSLFNKFIEEQKDPVSVSHTIYVDWLLKWFPGKVKIRTL